MEIAVEKLADLSLFDGLSNNEIALFIEKTGTFIEHYEKGWRILKAYEINPYIGIIVKGEAQIIAEDRRGNASIGHMLLRGAMLGCPSAVLGDEFSGVAVDSYTDTEVMLIPYDNLIKAGMHLGRIHGVIMQNFLTAFSRKMVMMMRKIEIISHKSLRERILTYLWQEAERQKTDIIKIPGRVQLAKILECNRSALTREINSMKDEGVLGELSNGMKILDGALI